MQISRRGLIAGLVSFVAAPAIVRASSLMPVKAFEPFYGVDLASGSDATMLIRFGQLDTEEWVLLDAVPYPGWRLREEDGKLIHEKL